MTCIVSYDIEKDSVRGKLSRFLEQRGLRLQKSVFIVEIDRHTFMQFLKRIETIAGKNGIVAVFRLCAGCKSNAIQSTSREKSFYIF